MRPNGARAEDHPGTYAHKARKLCSGCYNAGCAFELSATGARVSIEETARGLAAYLRWRAPMRAKAQAVAKYLDISSQAAEDMTWQ